MSQVTVKSLEKLISNRRAAGLPSDKIEPLEQELEQLRAAEEKCGSSFSRPAPVEHFRKTIEPNGTVVIHFSTSSLGLGDSGDDL